MFRTKHDDEYQPSDEDLRDFFAWRETLEHTPDAQAALSAWEAEQNAAGEALIDAAQDFPF